MTKEDEEEFLEFVRTTGKIEILPNRMSSPEERSEELPSPEPSGLWLTVYLYNSLIPGQLAFRYFDQTNCHVDPTNSPVIEFWRSDWSGKLLYPGRIWAEMYQPNPETGTFELHAEFKKWYEKIAGWIRRNYTRKGPLTYLGPEAMKLYEGGGELKDSEFFD